MTGIQADTHLFLKLNFIYDSCQLFEAASHLAAFACHGFKQHSGCLLRLKDTVKQLCNHLNAFFYALSHMASRMEVIVVPRSKFHAVKIILHGHKCKISCLLLSRTWIKSIRRVGNYLHKIVFFCNFKKPLYVLRIDVFCLSASGVSCKKLKGVGIYLQGLSAHELISLRRCKMTA